MATRKITITLDEAQLHEVRQLVAAGKAPSVSGFIKHAVGVALHDTAGWQTMLEQALAQSGGPLTREEIAWADRLLVGKRPTRRRRRKAA